MLTGVLCCLYEGLINFKLVALIDLVYAGTFSVNLFKLTLFCHIATNEERPSSIWCRSCFVKETAETNVLKSSKCFHFNYKL